ncbi:ATP-dependent zinc protease family protein [Nitrosomonas marina]|uniref:ATP-dependent zinc protease family protein n=1 Tax=Nitrosomonas marina TaxID=917 RepID=UPI0015A66BFE|nr:RimK/LysX family protein [Nitrosomonas marina]
MNRREDALIAREAAISARESELVTLFSELLKEKKLLESQQIQLENQISTVARKNNPPAPPPTSTPRTAAKKPHNTSKNTSTSQNKAVKDDITILGGLEYVYLDPPGINLSARIDTGAQTSSLNALDMVEFERDGKPYIKFNIIDPETKEKLELTRRIRGYTKIKKHKTESQRRPIVQLRVKLGNLDEQISFTLIDRSKFDQQVLIGRNFLRDLAVVDVSKEFTKPKTTPNTKQ